MSKYIPELKFENNIRSVFGNQWKSLPDHERDGAFGIAIVKAIGEGVEPNIDHLSSYLGVDRTYLFEPFHNLFMNGIFARNRIKNDSGLKKNDLLALCYYAGYATRSTGTFSD
jgi:hypothetical protein